MPWRHRGPAMIRRHRRSARSRRHGRSARSWRHGRSARSRRHGRSARSWRHGRSARSRWHGRSAVSRRHRRSARSWRHGRSVRSRRNRRMGSGTIPAGAAWRAEPADAWTADSAGLVPLERIDSTGHKKNPFFVLSYAGVWGTVQRKAVIGEGADLEEIQILVK